MARVKRTPGVLEDDLHALTQTAQIVSCHTGQVSAIKSNPALGRRQKRNGHAPNGRLAGTALTNQANDLARLDAQGHIAHRHQLALAAHIK